jgi:hypothetical protein
MVRFAFPPSRRAPRSIETAGRSALIRAFDLLTEGTARNGRIHFNVPGRSADGMSVDVQGKSGLGPLRPLAWTADALKTKAGGGPDMKKPST